MSHWTIDYTYVNESKATGSTGAPPQPGPGSPQQIERVEYTLTGRTAHVTTTLFNGENSEFYVFKDYKLLEDPSSHEIMVFDIGAMASPMDMFREDYPGFYGLSPSDYVNTEKNLGQVCLHLKKENLEAWLGAESGMPVAYKFGDQTGRYTFLPTPTDVMDLPKEYRQFLNSHFKKGPPPGQAASVHDIHG